MNTEKKKHAADEGADLKRLQELVVAHYAGDIHSIHGIAHWRRVERFGLEIAGESGADILVVRLFAWLHDSRRQNDNTDAGHGARAADWLLELHGSCFVLEAERLELLRYACRWHTERTATDDLTIGACWDADRLDLTRVGTLPDEAYLNTAHGKALCRHIRRQLRPGHRQA
jgi:uncharacterized protein